MYELRLKALELAASRASAPEDVVTLAQKFFEFLLSSEEKATEASSSVEPGTRKRKAKVEDVAQGLSVGSVSDAAQAVAKTEATAPVVDYKLVQQAVVTLVQRDNGKTAVVNVLDQFAVPTALQLKPEQYAEALDLLNAEIERIKKEVPLA